MKIKGGIASKGQALVDSQGRLLVDVAGGGGAAEWEHTVAALDLATTDILDNDLMQDGLDLEGTSTFTVPVPVPVDCTITRIAAVLSFSSFDPPNPAPTGDTTVTIHVSKTCAQADDTSFPIAVDGLVITPGFGFWNCGSADADVDLDAGDLWWLGVTFLDGPIVFPAFRMVLHFVKR